VVWVEMAVGHGGDEALSSLPKTKRKIINKLIN
jgi:hypothetical protein